MCKFEKDEARAIISVIIDVVKSDNELHRKEHNYVNNVGIKMGLTSNDVVIAQNMTPDQVSSVFSKMTKEKKVMATKLIIFATFIDGKVTYPEEMMRRLLIEAGILYPISESELMSINSDINDFMNS